MITKNPYILSFRFFKDKLWIIFLSAFGLFALLTWGLTMFLKENPNLAQEITEEFLEAASDSISEDGKISALGLFLNNVRACALGVALGCIPFIFLPAISIFANSLILGATFALYSLVGGSISHVVLIGILPHGIFELTALFLSWAMGIFLCIALCKRILLGQRVKGTVKDAIKNILCLFAAVVIPLLIIAALVEAYVTPHLVSNYM